MAERELVRAVRQGLIAWYDFVPFSKALYIGNEKDALVEVLRRADLDVICADIEHTADQNWREFHRGTFAYLVSVLDLETGHAPAKYLAAWQELLAVDGHLLLAVNNRLGLKYFCGERDPYTGQIFDGLEDYRRNSGPGRMYHRGEWQDMLVQSGWRQIKFYSVLSDLSNPMLIYADGYLPNENLAIRVMPTYQDPSAIFLDEEFLYPSLCGAGLFHGMANSYLVECTMEGELSDVLHVTSSLDRGKEDALLTVIHADGRVVKRAMHPEGGKRLQEIETYSGELRSRGIQVLEGRLEPEGYITPYVKAETAQLYLQRLLRKNKERFLQEMDRFRDLILSASACYEGCYGKAKSLEERERVTLLQKRLYFDMVPHNCFYLNGDFVFYDQEFVLEDYPVKMLLTRMVDSVCSGYADLNAIIPMDDLYRRYGLLEEKDRWHRMSGEFLVGLRKEKELQSYHDRVRKNPALVDGNRQRMNFSAEDYRRLYEDLLTDVEGKEIIVFGSGTYARQFLSMYGRDYDICRAVDNHSDRWGAVLEGVEICSPDCLENLPHGSFKVIICIKKYLAVMRQLDRMGVHDYGIYDPTRSYPKKCRAVVEKPLAMNHGLRKKYRVGYIAGVFDLFHVGHLNMFRRAKEQCEHLIVGVVSDDAVHRYKGTANFIPFEERIEMVRSCRYVDEAVEIPLYAGGTQEAWRMYHFDVQFSGSDYEKDPNWLAEREFLHRHGAELVFFPYTQSTSSTKLKALIEKRLI